MARISLNPPKTTAQGFKDRCEMPSPAGSSRRGGTASAATT